VAELLKELAAELHKKSRQAGHQSFPEIEVLGFPRPPLKEPGSSQPRQLPSTTGRTFARTGENSLDGIGVRSPRRPEVASAAIMLVESS